MQQLLWKDYLRDGTLEGGIDLANQLYWNITVSSDGDAKKWDVWGGEALLLRTDSQDAAEAFFLWVGAGIFRSA